MSAPEKPEKLITVSEAINALSAALPNGTAWVFAAMVKVGDGKLGAMLCTNQDTDEQARGLFEQAVTLRHDPAAVAESFSRKTMQ